MPFPPCKRCAGWMFHHFGRETFCVNCGFHAYNVPIIRRSILDREDTERRDRNFAKGSGRRRVLV